MKAANLLEQIKHKYYFKTERIHVPEVLVSSLVSGRGFGSVADTQDVLIYWGGEGSCPFSLPTQKVYWWPVFLHHFRAQISLKTFSWTCQKKCIGFNLSVFVKNPFPAHFKHVRSNYCKLKIFEVFAHFKKGTSVCSFEVVQCTRLLKKWKTSYFSFQDFAGAHFKIGLQIFETCA